MRINIYVDARFWAAEASQDMILNASGPKMRINIYVDARFGSQQPAFWAPKASQDMILTTLGSQSAHQRSC